jgi:FkbM family methyltransferase
MEFHISKDTYSWQYESGGPRPFWRRKTHRQKVKLAICNLPPVYFDTTNDRPRDWFAKKHMHGAMHEPMFSFVLAKLVQKVDPSVYFDIGAFLGYFTLIPLPLLRLDAQVYSFEMNARSCRYVHSSIILNQHLAISRVFVVNAGISEATELAKPARVRGFKLSLDGEEGGTDSRVDILSLDYIYKTMGIAPDLIKMDIEGFEAPALKGAKAVLTEKRPLILFELHSNTMLGALGASRKGVLGELKSLGYETFAVDGDRASRIETDTPLLSPGSGQFESIVMSGNSSFVAVPAEKLGIVADMIA